jgi:uncharacterized membrane protein YgaE (UPF0421/DUF939 family)
MTDKVISNCYHKLHQLWETYTRHNKNLTWNETHNNKFIQDFDNLTQCVDALLKYLESKKDYIQTSPAIKDEFNMLINMVEKYDKALRIKYQSIRARMNANRTAKLLAINSALQKVDTTYNAKYLGYVLPSVPKSSQRGGKRKGNQVRMPS